MSTAFDIAGAVLILAGAGFFAAGTLGLLRFPDALSRLHALTKADNLGLGLVAAGLALIDRSPAIVAKLALLWLLALAVSTTICHLLARHELAGRPDA